MNKRKTYHNEAMDLAEQATKAKFYGNLNRSITLFKEAFERESLAAAECASLLDLEPTRSVLHRSAASLAMQCGETRAAERLIATALAGNPPEEIATELRDLLEQVYFQRHLELRGVTLDVDEIQLSISGKGIGFGIAPSNEYIDRVQAFEKMVYRTAERQSGAKFRLRGNPEREIRENFELFVTVPRAASLAVTFKIGRNRDQMVFSFVSELKSQDILDEIVYCLETLNSGSQQEVEDHIADKAYYNNFIGLARKIAPDGEDVNQVGMSVYRDGKKKDVAITRATSEFARISRKSRLVSGPFGLASDDPQVELVEVWGKLKYADSISGEAGTIKLVEDDGSEHTVSVPEGMMADIVRPLWDFNVQVIGTKSGDSILLEHIRKRTKRQDKTPRKS